MTLSTSAIDSNRLRRASLRTVKRIGATRFQVEGRAEPFYLVDLGEPTPCACTDAGGPCLHELAARLYAGDWQLVRSLGELLAAAEREAGTLRARGNRSGNRQPSNRTDAL
jgi:hypothetical protein